MSRPRSTTYYTWKHSCYLLQYHLVLVTRYRHPVITGKVRNKLFEHAKDYFKRMKGIKLLEINGEPDHIHILFEGNPNMNLKDVISAYKSASSRYIRQECSDELKPYYWKPYFWSQSYFVTGVSETNQQLISEYIQNQGKN